MSGSTDPDEAGANSFVAKVFLVTNKVSKDRCSVSYVAMGEDLIASGDLRVRSPHRRS